METTAACSAPGSWRARSLRGRKAALPSAKGRRAGCRRSHLRPAPGTIHREKGSPVCMRSMDANPAVFGKPLARHASDCGVTSVSRWDGRRRPGAKDRRRAGRAGGRPDTTARSRRQSVRWRTARLSSSMLKPRPEYVTTPTFVALPRSSHSGGAPRSFCWRFAAGLATGADPSPD